MIITRLGCRQPNQTKLAKRRDVRQHPYLQPHLRAFNKAVRAASSERAALAVKRLEDPDLAAELPPLAQGESVIVSARSMIPRDAQALPLAPRVDQGASGSCTWGASAVVAWVACKSLGTPLAFLPSMRAGYALTRALERKAAGLAPATPLRDEGADLEDVFEVWRTWGIGPMETPLTPDGRLYDLWTDEEGQGRPGNVNDEPNLDELERSDHTRLIDLDPHTIHPEDWSAPQLLAFALAGGDGRAALPVLSCGFVDSKFCSDGDPDEVLGPCNAFDPNGGGHAFWFSAYRTAPNGLYEFKLENSWGSNWRADGAVWVNEAFIRSCWAHYVPNPTLKETP